MDALDKILACLENDSEVPADLFLQLSTEGQTALRAVEKRLNSRARWKQITELILQAATTLSQGKDREEVLQNLVQSARSILNSDVSYISLNKEEQQATEILITAGVVTREFKEIKMPFGTGVLGLVASKRQPAWTEDHGTDPEVSHVPEVDAAVRAEGIRGILGAPLTVEGKIIGALMVGDRRKRSYTASEILVLDSLASLASVALETSDLISSLESSVVALKEAHDESERRVSELKALTNTDSQLMTLLNHGTRASAIVEVASRALGCTSWFIDDEGKLLEKSGPDSSIEDMDGEEIATLIREVQTSGPLVSGSTCSALAININERFLGALCVDREVGDHEVRILHRVVSALATAIIFREALTAAGFRQVDDILRKLVAGLATGGDISRLRRLTGVDLHSAGKKFLVTVIIDGSLPKMQVLRSLLAENALVFQHDNHYCAILSDVNSLQSELGDLLVWAGKANVACYVGAVPLPVSLDELGISHDKACALADGLKAIGKPGEVATDSSFGSLGLLLGAGEQALRGIVENSIGGLIRYDEAQGTELVDTALVYFESGRQVVKTAKQLYVHDNTVRQRLERIGRILGDDWAQGAASFDVHLALRAWALIR
ncbi:helix-turn-helix domain-containing protein [Corynebacterium sp. 35RC1]|nr:helix-turn-helix domain-containing protein [Corynebacterium sp. 35RC1]